MIRFIRNILLMISFGIPNAFSELLNSQTNISKILTDYKRLQAIKSKDEMIRIVSVGLLSGAIQAEDQINKSLIELNREFNRNFNTTAPKRNLEKLSRIHGTMERDDRVAEILINAMDFIRQAKSLTEFKSTMDRVAHNHDIDLIRLKYKSDRMARIMNVMRINNSEKLSSIINLNKINESVRLHLKHIRQDVMRTANKTIFFLENNTPKRSFNEHLGTPLVGLASTKRFFMSKVPPSIKHMYRKITNNFRNIIKRQDDDTENEIIKSEDESTEEMNAKQDDDDDGFGSIEAVIPSGGGFAGLLSSLSGGDDGSDVGALVGALTGVITNLFGPDGLDVPGLISTGSALIAGLLAGDENFGKVLGEYIGEALDGVSGGGGAINNGQFVGQFLGTVIAKLSENPEDDELPLEPKLFIQNLFEGSKMAASKAGNDEDGDGEGEEQDSGGSSPDIFGFITNIVTSIVGGITSTIFNASLGSSGSASTSSSGASSGASAGGSGGFLGSLLSSSSKS